MELSICFKAIKQQHHQDQQAAVFNASLKEKLDSLKRNVNPLTRPLPDIPSKFVFEL